MFSIQTVIVLIDFSDASIRALEYAKEIARRFDAALCLAHVVPLSVPTFYAYPVPSLESQKNREKEVQDKLQELLSDNDRGGLRCRFIVRTGQIDEELLGAIAKTKSGLVVMGSHGRRGFEKWFIGSVASNMFRKVRVPILSVSYNERPAAFSFRRILAVTDLSLAALAGLEAAAGLARAFEARLTVLHVCESGEHDRANVIQSIPETVGSVNIDRVVIDGIPHEAIVRYAEQESFDLIALTLQGQGFVHEALLGATADRVIRSTSLPVLCVPGSAPAAS